MEQKGSCSPNGKLKHKATEREKTLLKLCRARGSCRSLAGIARNFLPKGVAGILFLERIYAAKDGESRLEVLRTNNLRHMHTPRQSKEEVFFPLLFCTELAWTTTQDALCMASDYYAHLTWEAGGTKQFK